MPSPKRQRTESPAPALESKTAGVASDQPLSPQTPTSQVEPKSLDKTTEKFPAIPGLGLPDLQLEPRPIQAQATVPESNCFLDALMQHVESISRPGPEDAAPDIGDSVTQSAIKKVDTNPQQDTFVASLAPAALDQTGKKSEEVQPSIDSDAMVPAAAPESAAQKKDALIDGVAEEDRTMIEEWQEAAGAALVTESSAEGQDQTMADAQHQLGAGAVDDEGAEWEVDSSPYVSSDSDDSSDTTSDDSDDDADGDYAMLDPEEQARILMAGDGGSEDGGDKKGKTEGGHLRTANEKIEEIIPKPDIVVTEDMKIEELGTVESVVENTVLVRATVSGEYQVLESNSLLCLADRSVVGVVAEPLGRVEQPMYTIRFTNDDSINEVGLSERGTKVFYVTRHSTFVFTQPLKAVKGSDASNFHDEEVGDDEMEFSDDEQEAEHRRQMKMKRQGRRDEQGGGRGRGRGGRGNYQRGGRQDFRAPSSDSGSIYGNGSTEISYDDVSEGVDEGYTPLTRPANLNEMMAGVRREPMEGSHYSGGYSDRGDSGMGRGRGRGRGRGDRDRRGGRGARGGGGNQPSWTTHQTLNQSNDYTQQSPQSMPPPSHFLHQYQQQQSHQPRLSPQTQNQAFSPSPISPLPPNQFDFNFQQHAQQWPGAQSYQQQQQYSQMPQTGSQYGAQQFGQHGQSNANGWNANQAAAAQVAAQLEQFRRSQGQ